MFFFPTDVCDEPDSLVRHCEGHSLIPHGAPSSHEFIWIHVKWKTVLFLTASTQFIWIHQKINRFFVFFPHRCVWCTQKNEKNEFTWVHMNSVGHISAWWIHVNSGPNSRVNSYEFTWIHQKNEKNVLVRTDPETEETHRGCPVCCWAYLQPTVQRIDDPVRLIAVMI